MPLAKRVKFVGQYDNKEALRELSSIWRMMKVDPLSPISYYFRNMVIPGAGLGLEGLVIDMIVARPRTDLSTAMFCSRLATSSRCFKLMEVKMMSLSGFGS